MNKNTSVTNIGSNSLHWSLKYGAHKVFGMHRLSHGRTECLRHYNLWNLALLYRYATILINLLTYVG